MFRFVVGNSSLKRSCRLWMESQVLPRSAVLLPTGHTAHTGENAPGSVGVEVLSFLTFALHALVVGLVVHCSALGDAASRSFAPEEVMIRPMVKGL
jgi:hypothetical protein